MFASWSVGASAELRERSGGHELGETSEQGRLAMFVMVNVPNVSKQSTIEKNGT